MLHAILDGLKEAGVAGRDVIVFSRYRQETLDAGIDKVGPDRRSYVAKTVTRRIEHKTMYFATD